MKINCKTKVLVTITICSLILCIIAGYFSFETNRINQELKEAAEEFNTTKNILTTTNEKLQLEVEKTKDLSLLVDELNEDLRNANIMLAELKSDEYKLAYMGSFKISYYCNEPYKHICGYGKRTTASGKPTEVGWTVAADWGVLPNGSVIYIEGIGYREVMDVGGSVNGKHIDVLVNGHQEALSLGNSTKGVWVLVKTS